MKINCIEYFLYTLKIFFWSVATLSPQDGAMAAHDILREKYCPQHCQGHACDVIARPTHHPTTYTWRVASLTNKTCDGSLLVHFFVLEIFDHWWLTDWMDMNDEIILSAQCLQPYVDRTCAVTAEQHVGLGYNNKVGCGHGSRTWQLTQQAACPSFARNHWLE